jgi:hypothetical protein
MALTYQIRRWNDHKVPVWELWRCRKGRWGRRVWDRLSTHKTEEGAKRAMLSQAESHYDEINDYDETGSKVYSGGGY